MSHFYDTFDFKLMNNKCNQYLWIPIKPVRYTLSLESLSAGIIPSWRNSISFFMWTSHWWWDWARRAILSCIWRMRILRIWKQIKNLGVLWGVISLLYQECFSKTPCKHNQEFQAFFFSIFLLCLCPHFPPSTYLTTPRSLKD